jgi:STE24 endopeptidase
MTDSTRKAWIGIAVGFALGYAALRATQALRDRQRPAVPLAERDPRRYGAARRALMLTGMVRGIASIGSVAFALADPLERALAPLPRALRTPAFALTVLALDSLCDLGVDYVEDHVLERVYGNSDQSARSWFEDHLKGLAVSAVVSAVMTGLADALVRRAPRRWPWIAVAASPPLLAFATVVAPTFVMPLFNRYEPVTGELETQIRALAARWGVGDASILRFDMSKQTRKANAFVTGVLGTERIVLADTLVNAFQPDETLFVVAHELGHYVRRDPWTGIAVGTVAVAGALLGADALLRATSGRGVDGPAQGARLLFWANVVQLVALPAVNAISRTLERRADRFAVAATGDAAAGVRAFRRLGEQNLAEFDPPRWAELLFASHPSLAARIRALDAQTVS